VLRAGKLDDRIVIAVYGLTDGRASGAFMAMPHGVPVGPEDPDLGRARYLVPAHVAAIAKALDDLVRSGVIPVPDDDGYSGDPREATDPAVEAAAAEIEAADLDPRSPTEMERLRHGVTELRDWYVAAASNGDGMLTFLR
jgi:hypothetical protein